MLLGDSNYWWTSMYECTGAVIKCGLGKQEKSKSKIFLEKPEQSQLSRKELFRSFNPAEAFSSNGFSRSAPLFTAFGLLRNKSADGDRCLLGESGADSLPLPQLGLQVHCHAQ
jgi:hypothetical protein